MFNNNYYYTHLTEIGKAPGLHLSFITYNYTEMSIHLLLANKIKILINTQGNTPIVHNIHTFG